MPSLDVCYDLSVSPPTYDHVSFLLAAEMERIDRGRESIALHILPGPRDGFREDKLPPFTAQERRQMRDQIVVPMSQLLPSCRSMHVHDERVPLARGTFGYGERRYGTKELVRAAGRGVYPFRLPGSPLAGPYVTITLREANYWPSRNSNHDQWVEVARALQDGGNRVIVVRDTDRADASFAEFEIAPKASRYLHERAALYAGAQLNLGINSGPMWLCLFMGASTLIVKMTSPDAPCVTDTFFRSCGFPRGSTWPNLRPRQCVSWALERASDIIAAAERLLGEAA